MTRWRAGISPPSLAAEVKVTEMSLHRSAGFPAPGERVPYAIIETVACPRCKAASGVHCAARHERRDLPEDHGIHAARTDAWIRAEKRAHAKKMRAIFALEEAEDGDRARRGLPRNMATLG